jgi:hypothetical protein
LEVRGFEETEEGISSVVAEEGGGSSFFFVVFFLEVNFRFFVCVGSSISFFMGGGMIPLDMSTSLDR